MCPAQNCSPAALAAIPPLHRATSSAATGGYDAISFLRDRRQQPDTADVNAPLRASRPDTIAMFLFTSGSTGAPKAVINTQRMLTSSQQAKAQTWPFSKTGRRSGDPRLAAVEPHVRRQSQLQLVLRNGGTLYIDGGKPAPGLFATSLANCAT